MQKNSQEIKNQHLTYLAFALTLLLIIRLLPILKSPLSNYGYDFGFYYYAASHAAWHWHDFDQIIWGGYNSLLFSLGAVARLPPAVVLVGSYFASALLLGVALYFLMKKFGFLSGVFAVVLLAGSLFQAESYGMFLWKNLIALPILILALKFLMEKNYKLFVFCCLTVLLIHRTTAIMLIITSSVYFILQLIIAKRFRLLAMTCIIGLMICSICYNLFPLKTIILNLITNNNYYVRTGLFLENQNLLSLWWPSLILALAGIILYIKHKQHSMLLIFAAVNLIWVILKLPFYRRTMIYLDIAVICFAAYFLGQINYSRKFFKIALAIIIIFLCLRTGQFILTRSPLISQKEISEIKNFQPNPGFILAISADDAPWLLAYTKNFRLGAPGLLENPRTYEQWQSFWQVVDQREFISKYPRPLYLYQRSWRLPPFGLALCLTPLTTNFSQLDYTCLEKTLP